jgi:SAM-dependent methyltransferase
MVGSSTRELNYDRQRCHACGGNAEAITPRYGQFKTVASDCKPSIDGLQLLVCGQCGLIQKSLDARWQAACDAIYGGYDLYHQSGGGEQVIINASAGSGSPRSQQIIQQMQRRGLIGARGKLLDVGCGNGAMLQSFSNLCPGWHLEASELSDRFRERVLSIPRVQAFHSTTPEEIDGRFDMVSLLHVLEHIPDPVAVLRSLHDRLAPGGVVLVQVPNLVENPYDLMVADHASHFLPAVLLDVFRRAGLKVRAWSTSWVAKEISVVASLPGAATAGDDSAAQRPPQVDSRRLVQRHVGWLSQLVDDARFLAAQGPLGIFGTSIAGTWIAAQLGDAVSFFVDEDASRIGSRHLGRPILAGGEAPAHSNVLIVLPPQLAARVQDRLQPIHRQSRFVAPSRLQAA